METASLQSPKARGFRPDRNLGVVLMILGGVQVLLGLIIIPVGRNVDRSLLSIKNAATMPLPTGSPYVVQNAHAQFAPIFYLPSLTMIGWFYLALGVLYVVAGGGVYKSSRFYFILTLAAAILSALTSVLGIFLGIFVVIHVIRRLSGRLGPKPI